VGEIVTRELHRESPPFAEKLRQLVQAKQLGRKSGQGFYSWRDGKVVREARGAPAPPDLTDRLILVLVNECVACAREAIVEDTDLIDAGVIFGTGFAPFRGGPIAYARSRGIDACVARLRELEQRYGARFSADAGWAQVRAS
jgi:3-hydroxyacyl-CoA dehydrogenase/enoyl-CoA hydratase/3-hydroxybutyryl-CoA epimerase